MKKLLVLVLGAILLMTGLPANAAVKAGASCSAIGSKKISGDKEFTCKRSGTKLVWNKGVVVKSSTGAKNTSKSKVISFLDFKKSKPKEDLTSSNLGKNYAYVPYLAWAKSGEKISKFEPTNLKLTVLVGPNTDPINKSPGNAVNLVSKMYGDYIQASEFVLIYYNFDDIAWAEKLVDEYIGKNGGYDTSGDVKKLCPSRNNCNSAGALTNSVTGIGLTMITASDQERSNPIFLSGTLEAHEYSHTIQKKQYFGRMPQGLAPPQWLTEGGAEFIQTASIHHQSFDKYLTDRNKVTEYLYSFKDFNNSRLDAFLNPSKLGTNWDLWKGYDGFRVYDIGFMVSEILVAIKGPNSIMEIFKLMGDGVTFQESFYKVFAVQWDLAISSITQALADQLS